jgi:type IV secretory pathway VirB3-like protein
MIDTELFGITRVKKLTGITIAVLAAAIIVLIIVMMISKSTAG